MLRLVDLSQLKVEGKVNSREANAADLKGQPVKVTLQMAGNQNVTFEGYVKTVGLDYQQAIGQSSSFVVQAIVNNQKDDAKNEWLLHPGAAVSMEITVD